ncbi:MAG TPA: arginine--tRNA ligase, partial [Candidatus Limnocylindrales bacterium]|nr:arginine--tRNA ligase [Candidatus Limnocylindrales bacterium]
MQDERRATPATGATTLRASARAEVAAGLARAIDSGRLPDAAEARSAAIELSRPGNHEHGDLASNLGLRLAKPLRMAPLAIATAIAEAMTELSAEASARGATAAVASVTAAAPGFLNLRLAEGAIEALLDTARREPAAWGRTAPLAGNRTAAGAPIRHVNVEFVSANPTGPLTVGNARGAFVGDLLSRVLEAGGQRVTREYYFNDSGNQVRNLGASVIALRDGTPIPADGYHGDYLVDVARDLPDEIAAPRPGDDADARAWAAGRWASARIREGIEASLANLGVRFDVWTKEQRLHDDGWVDQALDRLRAGGHLYEQDGALWFRSTTFGDDKDRVLVKSDGNRTYFASDIGYVIEKFSRGFDHLIYIWGADHHGTVARVRNAAQAMGFDKAAVEMILTGWVHFLQNGQELSMSKRAGTFIALDDLLAELGVDAARWYFASRGANVNMDVDIEVAKAQSSENPVYYVQYAHARIASILRKAADTDLAPAGSLAGALEPGSPEAVLARVVVRLPEVVEDAAAAQETQGVTTYATELATAFHAFYRDARVVDAAEPERSKRRLALVDATRISLANSLALLGISAPESM